MESPLEIRVVAYPEGGFWIAQGLEYDIIARGRTLSEAFRAFERAIVEAVCIGRDLGQAPLANIDPAPAHFQDMFERSGAGYELRSTRPIEIIPGGAIVRLHEAAQSVPVLTDPSGWMQVGKFIEIFVLMGCELRELRGKLTSPEGEDHKVRYLFNPENQRFYSLSDLPNEALILKSEVAAAERRLGMAVPPPP